MNTKKWIPVMVLTVLLMATSFLMVQSDDSEAVSTENATHLQGTFGYVASNMTGKVEFVTSNDTTITAFSYKIMVNLSTYTVVVNNSSSFNFTATGTNLPTLYWDWSASDSSNIVLWESSTSGNTHSFAISNTSGLSGGVKYVSASNASSADIPINCPKTITNIDFPSITISQDSAISGWDCRVYYYTISFTATDYGNVSSASVTVPQGSTIWYEGSSVKVQSSGSTQTITATPDTATAQYTYSFTGWAGIASTPTVIASDMSVTANFSRTVNNYTVTFDANPSHGSVSPSSLSVPYGTVITESANTLSVGGTTVTATPNDPDIQYTYSFDSWTIPQSTVEGNMTVTASFSTTVNNYVISIESSNTAFGTVDDSIVYAPYGTAYSVSGNTLTIGTTVITATPTVGDAQYNYALYGWSVSSGTVTSNMSIIANFEQTVREYTVTINVNNSSYGTVNKNSVTVPYGSTMVVSGLGLYIGNTIVTTTPTPATIDTNYWFGGWTFPSENPSGSTITHNITVTANFESGVRYYEITFVTLPDGYGTLDIDYPYSTSNGYHASYGSTISVSDDVLTIDGLTDITATARPSAQEVDWTYVFDNWTIPAYTVTGDMTINANFTRTANTVVNVTVSTSQGHFYEGGNEYTSHVFRVPIPSSVSQDSETGTLHLWNYEITADMTVLTEQYEYTFFIWDGVPVGGGSVSDGMNISAIYHSEDRYYEVNFSIADGFGTLTTERVLVLYNTLIYSENNVVVVGANTIIATPTENGEDVTYEFVRWDGIPMSGRILEDTDISAKVMRTVTADAFNIVEIEHGDVERVWSVPDEYLPLMLVIPVMLLIGMILLSLNRKSDGDDYESY